MWGKIKPWLWLVVVVLALLGWGIALGHITAMLVESTTFVLANELFLSWFATMLISAAVARMAYLDSKDAINPEKEQP